MGSLIDQAKIESMSYNETIEAFRNIIYSEKEFDELLENFKKYNENINITKFPHKNLKELLKKEKKENINLFDELKKEYVKIFKNYYIQHSSRYGRFYEILKNAKDYNELIKEQKNYFEYKELEKSYIKKIKVTKLSANFSLFLFNYVRIENDDEKINFLEKTFNEEFSTSCTVYSYNLGEKETELFNLYVDKEIEQKQSKQTKKQIQKYYDDDDDEEDNDYDNHSYNNTYNKQSDDYYDNHSYNNNSYHNTISSSSYKNNSNSTKNSSNKQNKKKVKVIMCYSCKGKNKCPLCGEKISSRVSLGNLYAHPNCYNEGTCCLCNKKGPGNQVQSICSNCRKSTNSKGLTGSARCFICRKLI